MRVAAALQPVELREVLQAHEGQPLPQVAPAGEDAGQHGVECIGVAWQPLAASEELQQVPEIVSSGEGEPTQTR